MDKVGYPRGLIRYSTTHAMDEKLTRSQMFQRVLRPRVLVYTGVLAAIVIAMLASLWLRVPLRVDVIRDRAAIVRYAEGGAIENVYRLQIMNTTEAEREFEIRVEGLPTLHLAGESRVRVPAAGVQAVPVRLRVQGGQVAPGSHRIRIAVVAVGDESVKVRENSVFIIR